MPPSRVDDDSTSIEAIEPTATSRHTNNRQQRLDTLLRHDLPASLVVFLVALPLSLGIAIASGAPLMAGLIAAVVGGVVAGCLGGSPLQVSGPAAGLTVVVAELIDKFGWETTCLITVGAGILQILFGLSRIARAALAISPMVVHAMLAGIGVTIALQQVHVLLGGNSHSSSWENLKELPGQLGSAHLADALVGIVVVAVLVGWRWVPAKLRPIPAPLVAVVAATVLSLAFPLDVERIKLDGSLFDAIALPSLPDGQWLGVATGVLTIALIASVESLLSAVSVDKMHTGPRADLNRELIGQGAANTASGLLGGLPVTGVIVRSSTNVMAGARTRASAVLHGIWILMFSALLAGIVEQIPKAALAGLLIVIGIRLIQPAHLRVAHRTGDLALYTVTMLCVVFLNLLEGVLIGSALAFAQVLWRVVRADIHAEPIESPATGNWRVVVKGSLSFLAVPRLTTVLASVPPATDVTVDLNVDFLDHATYEVLHEWSRQHRAGGGTVRVEEHGRESMAAAASGKATRSNADARMGGITPWWAWQNDTAESDESHADHKHQLLPMLAGIADYHRTHATHLRPHLDGLPEGQSPQVMFLTCADSRIVPNVITSSGPGDLFTVRNVGNVVPDDSQDGSIEASIAFAVDELEVSSIVVCGHSGCGAMHALLAGRPEHPDGNTAVHDWLAHAQTSKDAFEAGHPLAAAAADAGFRQVDQLSVVNVALQVETLERHPLVRAAVAKGRLQVAGLFFDLDTARLLHVTSDSIAELDEANR